VWIVPLVILVVALFEDIVSYKARQLIHNIYLRAAVILVLNAVAFGLAAGWLVPRIRSLLTTARTTSNRAAGTVGLVAFYVLAYGTLYVAYVLTERSGTGALLPSFLR
jgi:hypothetical protein